MPISTKRISLGIYLHTWCGDITMDDIRQTYSNEVAFFAQDNIDKYVSIIDGRAMKKMPLDFTQLTQFYTGHELATIACGTPRFFRKVANIVGKLVQLPVEFVDTQAEAISRAEKHIASYLKQDE